MRYLTERHAARAEALTRRVQARNELIAAGEDVEAAAPWEAELIAAGQALRKADDLPEELECVCGEKNPVNYAIYHVDAITRHRNGSTGHETVNLHRLECEACSVASDTYHARR